MTADQLQAILQAVPGAAIERLESIIGRLVMDGVRDAARADLLQQAAQQDVARQATPTE